VRLHEINLHGLVSHVDKMDARQIEPTEVIGPQRDPRRAVQQAEALAAQTLGAGGLGFDMGDARDPQIVREKPNRIHVQAAHQ
jgi:hypothetical protein